MAGGVTIPAGYGLATALFSVTGRTKWYSTAWGYSFAGDASTDNTEDIWDAITTTGTLFKNTSMSTQYAIEGLRLRQQGDPNEYSFEKLTHIQGTAALNPPSPNVSVLIRKISGLSGKKHRGRLYLPPFNETEADIDVNGLMTTTQTDIITGWAEGMRGNLEGSGFPMVILHHGAGAPTAVSALSCERLVATQRRRLR